jgi:hypothetical protein
LKVGKTFLTPRMRVIVNPLTPELNPSAQRCLTKFFTGDFLLEPAFR